MAKLTGNTSTIVPNKVLLTVLEEGSVFKWMGKLFMKVDTSPLDCKTELVVNLDKGKSYRMNKNRLVLKAQKANLNTTFYGS